MEEPADDGRQQAAPPEPARPTMELAAGPATLLDEPLPPAAARERPLREEIVVPPRRLPPVAQPERGPSLILAWTLSILLLLAVVAALLVWQEEIGAAWPPSQWLYRALGLT
ncbi:hypothetical protein MVG78_08065 [Roseomonas gilardii subsp. gilardii]|uniref:hypothetical protein n=1 Tax=Roseomonas gilardii TaxID=257708 RepID=UPI001FFC2A77|nr:hypothetical protein [Roseomonas gilardii]UPG74069.1 hypothetical protein MVG78_08065 [Roseomonas gilardii subsp. gilardii]